MLHETSSNLTGHLGQNERRALETIFLDYRITLISCLYWTNRPPWALSWRQCPDTFFLFPECGEVRVTLKGRTLGIRPGQFLMLAENTRHALTLKPGFRELRQFALHCHIQDRWGRPLISRFSSPVGIVSPECHAALQELTCLMGHHPEAAQPCGETLLRELLAAQIRRGLKLMPPPKAGDPRVGVVLDHMEQELSSPDLSVESLARRVRITPVHLRKLFREETGQSPRRFLISLRLRRAAGLLQQSTASIKEVAASCGFACDHYFHLSFRRQFSCTPSQYRLKTLGQV